MVKFREKIFPWVKFLLGWPLSIVSIIYILRFVVTKSSAILPRLSNVNIILLTVGSLCFVLCYLLRIYAWHVLMKEKGYPISFKENIYRWEISEIRRYIPGNIWSFASRAGLYSEVGVPKKTSGKAMLVEVELVILASFIISFLSLNLIKDYFALRISLEVLQLIFLSLALFLSLVFITGKLLLKNFSTILPDYSLKTNFYLLAIYIMAFTVMGFGTYLVSASLLGLNFLNPVTSIGLFMFALLIGYLSFITPSGIGVREGVITFGLAKTIGLSLASLVAIYSRIVLVLTELIFMITILFLRKMKLL